MGDDSVRCGQLPEPVLVNLLHHVPQQERLSCCIGQQGVSSCSGRCHNISKVTSGCCKAEVLQSRGTNGAATLYYPCFNPWLTSEVAIGWQHAHWQQMITINIGTSGLFQAYVLPEALLLPGLKLSQLQALSAFGVNLQWQGPAGSGALPMMLLCETHCCCRHWQSLRSCTRPATSWTLRIQG